MSKEKWLDDNGNEINEEYIIISKTAIQKRIEEWETELQECYKAPVGKFNHDYVSTLQQAIVTAREILSQSTPLIPEIEKAIQFGKDIRSEKSFINPNFDSPFVDYEDSTEETTKYISTLKLDI